MRLPLSMLEVFAAIAEHGSMRAAAQSLGLKPSTVSHQLKNLEARIGTKLVIRSSRSLNLTEAGAALIGGTGPAFIQINQAFENAQQIGVHPQGPLKIALPELAYHAVVADIFPGFQKAYPQIELELSITDALEDILQAGLHAGIRTGEIVSDDMIAIRLTDPLRLAIAGSPDYFNEHGVPETPEDLLQHDCIRYRFISSGSFAPWIVTGKNGDYSIRVTGTSIVNSLPVAVDVASRGGGLVFLLESYVSEQVRSGQLQLALENHMADTTGLFLYYPGEYRHHKPLRAFINYLTERN